MNKTLTLVNKIDTQKYKDDLLIATNNINCITDQTKTDYVSEIYPELQANHEAILKKEAMAGIIMKLIWILFSIMGGLVTYSIIPSIFFAIAITFIIYASKCFNPVLLNNIIYGKRFAVTDLVMYSSYNDERKTTKKYINNIIKKSNANIQYWLTYKLSKSFDNKFDEQYYIKTLYDTLIDIIDTSEMQYKKYNFEFISSESVQLARARTTTHILETLDFIKNADIFEYKLNDDTLCLTLDNPEGFSDGETKTTEIIPIIKKTNSKITEPQLVFTNNEIIFYSPIENVFVDKKIVIE